MSNGSGTETGAFVSDKVSKIPEPTIDAPATPLFDRTNQKRGQSDSILTPRHKIVVDDIQQLTPKSLKANVQVLKGVRDSMKAQRDRQRKLNVSKTELLLLRTQIQYNKFNEKTTEMDHMVQKLTEILREISYLKELRESLQQELELEFDSRKSRMVEIQQLRGISDMSDLKFSAPIFCETASCNREQITSDIHELQTHLASLAQHSDQLNNSDADLKLHSAALSEYIKASNLKWKHSQLGSSHIRENIKILIDENNAIENSLKNTEKELIIIQNERSDFEANISKDVEKLISQINNNKNYFNEQIQLTENEKARLLENISGIISVTKEIEAQIHLLKEQKHDYEGASPVDEDIYVNSEVLEGTSLINDVEDDYADLEDTLKLRKKLLEDEIEAIKEKVSLAKKKYEKKIKKKKDAIEQLQNKLKDNRQSLKAYREKLNNNEETIANISNKIDEEVNNIQNFFDV